MSSYFTKENIMLDVEEKSRKDLFHFVSNYLVDQGVVDGDYEQDLLDRELDFPTGLLVGDLNVAIPHANNKHVHESCVVICRLREPIAFFRMDEPSEEVRVSLVFFLVLKKSEEHLGMLQKIVRIVQDQVTMQQLITADNADQILEIVTKK